MLTFAITALMALAGYAGAPWWVTLFGVVGIASEGWWMKVQRLRQHPDQPWSTKVKAYFVTGILANIGISAIGYAVGRILRAALG